MKLLALSLLIVGLALPSASYAAKPLPNKNKILKKNLKECEAQAKHYVSLGYPEKANKQLNQCGKIKAEYAKIKKQSATVNRKIASLRMEQVERKPHKAQRVKHHVKHKKHIEQSQPEALPVAQPEVQPTQPTEG